MGGAKGLALKGRGLCPQGPGEAWGVDERRRAQWGGMVWLSVMGVGAYQGTM